MEENNKWVGLVILAIVAIVAVVGLILLFKGFTSNMVTGSAIIIETPQRFGAPLTSEQAEILKTNEHVFLTIVDDILCPGIQEERAEQEGSGETIVRSLNCYIISGPSRRI